MFGKPEHANAIRQAADALKAGNLVGMPTETVYGLAADALNPHAVARIFAVKERPFFDPLIVHCLDLAHAQRFASAIPDAAKQLATAFWPGPLTLVLPKQAVVPDLVTSGLPHVALRVPAHPIAQALLQEFGGPLAAPSANKFGRISPTTAAAVREELGDAVAIVLDGGACAVGIESTIISFISSTPQLLRPGGVPLEAIEKVLGYPIDVPVRAAQASEPSGQSPAIAPGQLASHYAPRTPLFLRSELDLSAIKERTHAALLLCRPLPADFTRGYATVNCLSQQGDLVEAAAALFDTLRSLDALRLQRIDAVGCPEVGLGRAINDRLRRASAR